MDIAEYSNNFSEEPGYLNFASVGPVGATVTSETIAFNDLLARARFGTIGPLHSQDLRVRRAVSRLIEFPVDNIVFQPNTSQGLMHTMFGLTGGVAISSAEFPSLTYAALRASENLGVVTPIWLETDHGRITPGNLRDQLTNTTEAVALSLVDFRTGYLADIEGIRQVIGDRLLIVDASQGFGVVDAPYRVADVVVSCGYKWARAGWSNGFMAMSDRARERLTPVWSGFRGTGSEDGSIDQLLPPASSALAFQLSNPDPVAQGCLAAALEEIAEVGVGAISRRIADTISRIIDLADEFAIPVVSSRDESERAGIVTIQPTQDQLTVMTASLFNHGVSATARSGAVRLSAHASTTDETLGMLRASFTSFAAAIKP